MKTLFDDLTVSRETYSSLETHALLVKKWTRSINLIAKSTSDDIWRRHVLDSAQLWPLVPERAYRLVDLGSGAGFPGLVLAILMREKREGATVMLVESDRRKAVFLREAIRETGGAATVTAERAEALDGVADVVTARAFAPLDGLLDIAAPIVGDSGTVLLHKGRRYESELTAAAENWKMDTKVHRSRIDPDSVILRIDRLERRQDMS